MRPIDHFYSRLEKTEGRASKKLDKESAAFLERDFSALLAPALGASAAGELFARARERVEKGGGSLTRLGAIAAFFLGEFDDGSMSLTDDDWEDIRETLDELSCEMDLPVLTSLMGELLSRGKL
jgi:hypothetical protein